MAAGRRSLSLLGLGVVELEEDLLHIPCLALPGVEADASAECLLLE
jgi:hypothetical protein